jgi:Domain of unknown function (DUF4437)
MRTGSLLLISVAAVGLAATSFAQQAKPGGAGTGTPTVAPTPPVAPPMQPMEPNAGTHVMLGPNELQWVDGPPSLPKGAKVAVLEGDPSKAGPFTMRAQVPAKYKIPPHWHPGIEHVTVLSGEVYMGSGEKYDEASAKKLPAGSFAVMPVKYNHYFFTKKKAVIQLHGMGPWGITYINPADDPRNAGGAPPAATPPTPTK